jgi:hypothetical protein
MLSSPRFSSLRLCAAVLALTGAVACNQADSATTSSELDRDLEATKTAEMEMAGARGPRTDVVSGIERIPTSQPQPVAKSPSNPIPEKQASEVTPLPDILPSDRPRPTDPPKPTRRGPYKSTSEVIRNAPFPINP